MTTQEPGDHRLGAPAVVPVEAYPVVVANDRQAPRSRISAVISFDRAARFARAAKAGGAGGYVDTKRLRNSVSRKPVKRVLTFWHAGCTFIAYRKRTGAIPKAEGQQNADGFRVKPGLVGVQLCRRPLEREYLPGRCGDTWFPRSRMNGAATGELMSRNRNPQ
jgi:hypothetical protein